MVRVRIDDAGNVVEAGGRRLFDADDVPTNLENFVARSRQYLPLVEVIKSRVKVKPGHEKRGKTFANCHDIPINLVLDRILRSPSRMEETYANPGGHLLARESGSRGTGMKAIMYSRANTRVWRPTPHKHERSSSTQERSVRL